MDAPDPQHAPSLPFGGAVPGGSAAPADAKAVIPPPLGDVDADPAAHRVAANLRRELVRQLRRGDATVLDACFRVRAGGEAGGTTYHPDLVVAAGESDHAAHLARQPKVIFEVAEAGTERAAFIESWRIHEKLPTVDVHVLVDPARMSILVHRRSKDGGWQAETLTGTNESISLPTIHCTLTLETIYQDVLDGGDEERI